MKRFITTAAVVSAFGLTAFADDHGGDSKFAKIDADGNAMISQTEFVNYKTADGEYTEAEATEKFGKLAGEDGLIDEAEFDAAMAAWEESKDDMADEAMTPSSSGY